MSRFSRSYFLPPSVVSPFCRSWAAKTRTPLRPRRPSTRREPPQRRRAAHRRRSPRVVAGAGSRIGRGVVAALVVACASCARARPAPAILSETASPASAPISSRADPLADLRELENPERARTDFARKPASNGALGADPYVVRELP